MGGGGGGGTFSINWRDRDALTSEALKPSVKCVLQTHLTEDVKVVCLIFRFYARR